MDQPGLYLLAELRFANAEEATGFRVLQEELVLGVHWQRGATSLGSLEIYVHGSTPSVRQTFPEPARCPPNGLGLGFKELITFFLFFTVSIIN